MHVKLVDGGEVITIIIFVGNNVFVLYNHSSIFIEYLYVGAYWTCAFAKTYNKLQRCQIDFMCARTVNDLIKAKPKIILT